LIPKPEGEMPPLDFFSQRKMLTTPTQMPPHPQFFPSALRMTLLSTLPAALKLKTHRRQ
jgi:hypothetical protein